MDIVRKPLSLWVAVAMLYLATLFLLPHNPVVLAPFLSYTLQTLLFVFSLSLFRREPNRRTRLIFLNFSFFFSLSILAHLFSFVGPVIPATLLVADAKFAGLIIDQYVFRGAYFFLLAFAIVYLAVDTLFQHSRALLKYGVALLVVGSLFAYHYRPFFQDPLYLHRTVQITEWKALDGIFSSFKQAQGREPSLEELTALASGANLDPQYWKLSQDQFAQKVAYYYPYLFGDNWQILVYRPLGMNQIYMSVLCIGFILLFFGYQFAKDPPQGAYMEKVMFMLLIFCTLEAAHAWISVNLLEWGLFRDMYIIGQYVSVMVIASLAIIFGLRLRFIRSAKGEFYEQELATSPAEITRWRDILDNIVIEKFFNRKVLLGRMLVDPTRR